VETALHQRAGRGGGQCDPPLAERRLFGNRDLHGSPLMGDRRYTKGERHREGLRSTRAGSVRRFTRRARTTPSRTADAAPMDADPLAPGGPSAPRRRSSLARLEARRETLLGTGAATHDAAFAEPRHDAIEGVIERRSAQTRDVGEECELWGVGGADA